MVSFREDRDFWMPPAEIEGFKEKGHTAIKDHSQIAECGRGGAFEM